MAVLCMLHKIRCNPMDPLYGGLPVPYAPVRVTRGALVAHRYTYSPPRCRISLYRRTFIALCVPVERSKDLSNDFHYNFFHKDAHLKKNAVLV